MRCHLCAHRPADHTSREQIDDDSHIEPSLRCPNVSEVGNPFAIRSGRVEASIEHVGAVGALGACNRINRSIRCKPHFLPPASLSTSAWLRRFRSLAMKLARTFVPNSSSLRLRRLPLAPLYASDRRRAAGKHRGDATTGDMSEPCR
jgi:hypothetical protein